MRYIIDVPCDDIVYRFYLLPSLRSQRFEVPNVVIFDIFKYHDHRYDLQAFFYAEKVIISSRSFGSKKELVGAIQKLLQKFL